MTQEFSRGSDNNNHSPTAENLTSIMLSDEVTRTLRATNPPIYRGSVDLPPGTDQDRKFLAAPGQVSDSYSSGPTSSRARASAGETSTGTIVKTEDEQLNFKDDSLFCGETQSRRAAEQLNWNQVPAALETIGYCQRQASTPKSFTNFMQNVVKHDTFWGAEIELEYSTDKKLDVQVSGFTIK